MLVDFSVLACSLATLLSDAFLLASLSLVLLVCSLTLALSL